MIVALVPAFAFALALTPPSPEASIAQQERVELGSVSYDGHVGATSVELARITALGDGALPVLLAMSRSTSPVVRVAAAAGLIGNKDAGARAALQALAGDHAPVTVALGCLQLQMTVAAEVQHLTKYGVY